MTESVTSFTQTLRLNKRRKPKPVISFGEAMGFYQSGLSADDFLKQSTPRQSRSRFLIDQLLLSHYTESRPTPRVSTTGVRGGGVAQETLLNWLGAALSC